MGAEFENFAGAFLLSTKTKGNYPFRCFLFFCSWIILAVQCFLINYSQELGRKYVVQNKTWNNRYMKIDESLRLILEFVFVCRCCEGIRVDKNLFCKVPGVVSASVVLPRIACKIWLMMTGVMYLVAASFDNVEAIIMDCLAFELIFDVEEKLYGWIMGDIHDAMADTVEKELDAEGWEELGQTTQFSAFGPLLRLVLAVGITFAFDASALSVMVSETDDRLIDLFYGKALSMKSQIKTDL